MENEKKNDVQPSLPFLKINEVPKLVCD